MVSPSLELDYPPGPHPTDSLSLACFSAAYEAKPAESAKPPAPAKKGMRRGFFDAPRKKPQPGRKKKAGTKEGMVEVKAAADGEGKAGGEGEDQLSGSK